MARLFGYEFKRLPVEEPASFTAPINDDGAAIVSSFGSYGTVVDLDGTVRTEAELITKYREMSIQPEIDAAIEDIVTEAIVQEDEVPIVQLTLEEAPLPDNIKSIVQEEFDSILNLIKFNNQAYDLFKRYYIDGRLFFHALVDEKSPGDGIKEVRYIDPRKIRKVREVQKIRDKANPDLIVTKTRSEYYIYNEAGFNKTAKVTAQNNPSVQGIKIANDAIVHVVSGLQDANGSMVLSFLHKSIKPMNQLRALEDATLIYRICLVGDTRVKTLGGYKYIKDISVDDEVYVFTINGLELAKVKNTWNTGTKPIFQVSSMHHRIKGTSTHPILVLNKKTNVIEYVPISELSPKLHSFVYEQPDDEETLFPLKTKRPHVLKLLNPHIWSHYKIDNKDEYINSLKNKYECDSESSIRNFLYGDQYIDQDIAIKILDDHGILHLAEFDQKYKGFVANEINLPDFIDEEFARLFGFLIGDGTVTDYSISFAEGTDSDQNVYYSNLLKKYFNNCTRHPNSDRKYVNWTTSNTLGSEILRDLGFVNGSKVKRIPEWVFRSSNLIKKSFIKGLCDADGHIKENPLKDSWSCSIELSNKNLIEDIKELWTSIGLSSGHISTRIRSEESRVFGDETNIRTIPETQSWTVYLSNIPLKKFDNILSIESVNEEDVYDIEIDHEKHNFIANGIVVHNSRAPERRVFYIDVGNLPKAKAEQHLRDVMIKHKNKVVYDAQSGEIRDDRKFTTMLEDFWLPRRSDGKATEITTLPSGQNLGEMADVEYFQKRLYKSLNVPITRLDPERAVGIGRTAEITRDEIKFSKFIDRLRMRFSELFISLIGKQLILKMVITPEEWDVLKPTLKFKYARDNYASELKDAEILTSRLGIMRDIDPYAGKYYSHTNIRKTVLKQTDEDIMRNDQEIAAEMQIPQYNPMLMPQPEQNEPDPNSQ